jgi:hypothetical protein
MCHSSRGEDQRCPTVSLVMTFEIVTIAVSVGAIALCFLRYFRPGPTAAELGRQGHMWFDHLEDIEVAKRPSDDVRDSEIPRRHLRGRF